MTEQRRTPGVGDSRAPQTPVARAIPQATVTRLAAYLRVLGSLSEDGVLIVSSDALSSAAGVGSATLRKDLSFLGPNGVRGVGYDVARLRARIELALGLDREHRVVLVGLGNLGSALAGYRGFDRRGFTTVGLFDSDEAQIGRVVDRLTVRSSDHIVDGCRALEATIGVIATPDSAAQSVADALVEGGVQCILSFAQADLVVPAHVEVRRVDLAVELQVLSFNSSRNSVTREDEPIAGATEPATSPQAPARPYLGRPVCSPDSAVAAATRSSSTRGSTNRNGSVTAP